MIILLARPEKAPVVNGEKLYSIEMRVGTRVTKDLLRVRAENGAAAEEKIAFCFNHELKGKTLDFDPATISNTGAS